MTRRTIGLLITLVLGLLAAEAQPATKVWRIGFLTPVEVPWAKLATTSWLIVSFGE